MTTRETYCWVAISLLLSLSLCHSQGGSSGTPSEPSSPGGTSASNDSPPPSPPDSPPPPNPPPPSPPPPEPSPPFGSDLSPAPSIASGENEIAPASLAPGTAPPLSEAAAASPEIAQSVQNLTVAPCEGTQTAGSPSFALPVSGSTLQSGSGTVCGELDGVPESLRQVASTYQIAFDGDRSDFSSGAFSSVGVTLGGDPSTTSNFTPPAKTGAAWQAQFRGQTSTVNATNIGLNIDGEVVNIPVTGFGVTAPTAAPSLPDSSVASSSPPPPFFSTSSSGLSLPPFYPSGTPSPPPSASSLSSLLSGSSTGSRRRSLLSRSISSMSSSSHMPTSQQTSHRLLQDSSDEPTYSVRLTVNRCGGSQPVPGATVAAILNGFTASNKSVALPSGTGNVYTGSLNFATLFPGISFSTTSSLNFCTANRDNVQKACNPGGTKGQTFGNQTVLLNACTSFLSSGATTQISAAPAQIVQACSIIAIELAIICRSAGAVDCRGAAQETFTVNVSASVEATSIRPGLQNVPVFGSIFQNTLNGKSGVTTIEQTACVS